VCVIFSTSFYIGFINNFILFIGAFIVSSIVFYSATILLFTRFYNIYFTPQGIFEDMIFAEKAIYWHEVRKVTRNFAYCSICGEFPSVICLPIFFIENKDEISDFIKKYVPENNPVRSIIKK